MSDSKNDIIMDHYYCPCCLKYTPIVSEAPERSGFGYGECEMCYYNLGRHNKFTFLGRCSLNEAQEFLKDPARKSDPRFEQEAYDARKNYVPIQYEDLLAENEKIRNRIGGYTVVECPYCHSKNTTKISSVSKALNTAMFGILGNKRNQQWHCNSCRSDF